MAAKYNYSRKLGNETFQIINCDSFDEAIKIVEKGIYDRILSNPLRPFMENPLMENPLEVPVPPPNPTPEVLNTPSVTVPFIPSTNQINENN